jgi:hypothetical protein
MKIKTLILAFTFFCITALAYAQPTVPVPLENVSTIEQRFDGTMYTILDSNKAKVTWEHVTTTEAGQPTTVLGYRVRLVWIDPTVWQEYPVIETTNNYIELTAPRAGHFIVEVYAYDDNGYSGWSRSDNENHAEVDGVPRAWIIYFKIAAPSW